MVCVLRPWRSARLGLGPSVPDATTASRAIRGPAFSCALPGPCASGLGFSRNVAVSRGDERPANRWCSSHHTSDLPSARTRVEGDFAPAPWPEHRGYLRRCGQNIGRRDALVPAENDGAAAVNKEISLTPAIPLPLLQRWARKTRPRVFSPCCHWRSHRDPLEGRTGVRINRDAAHPASSALCPQW